MGKNRWTEADIAYGLGTVIIKEWQSLLDYVCQAMLDYPQYIWRGHRRDDWSLEPTLDRLVKHNSIPDARRHAFRREHLERFKFAARGRRGQNPPPISEENEWWAVGQHHGLATPLLDWTESPFVAAYFAFIEQGVPQTQQRAVYALHRPLVEAKAQEHFLAESFRRDNEVRELRDQGDFLAAEFRETSTIRKQVEIVRPLSDENPRLVNQAGLFTRAPDGTSLQEWVRGSFRGENQQYVLMELKMRGSAALPTSCSVNCWPRPGMALTAQGPRGILGTY